MSNTPCLVPVKNAYWDKQSPRACWDMLPDAEKPGWLAMKSLMLEDGQTETINNLKQNTEMFECLGVRCNYAPCWGALNFSVCRLPLIYPPPSYSHSISPPI